MGEIPKVAFDSCQKQTQVDRQIARLRDSVDTIACHISTLHDRLNPVLLPDPPLTAAPSVPGPPKEALVILAEEIDTQVRYLNKQILTLESMLQRLEL